MLEREEEGEKEREKHGSVASCTHPDQGPNPQPLVYRTTLQPTKPPGQGTDFFLAMRTFKIYPLSNFQIPNTVLLTMVTMLSMFP